MSIERYLTSLLMFFLGYSSLQAQTAQSILIASESFDLKLWQSIKSSEAFTNDDLHEVFARPKGEEPVLKFVRVQSNEINVQALIRENLFSSVEEDVSGQIASCSFPDPGYSLSWGLENTGSRNGSVAGADISACEAWSITTGDSNIVVGIIDSGNKNNHPDLSGRIWTNQGEIPGNNIDDDNNGFVDDIHGWNTWQGNNDLSDLIGHGTQINGIIGSNPNNGNGFVGVDHACQLINVKGVNNQGQGLNSWWAEGIYYLVDNGADIINMSLTTYAQVQIMQDALQYAEDNGVLVVAAVGNDNSSVGYPAKFPTVLAVGATDHADNRALWSGVYGSNFGPEVDVVAPGKAIYGINPFNNTTQYVTAGTSQATPHATGVAALMLALNSELTPDTIRAVLKQTAEDQVGLATEDTPGFDHYHGYGRLNAFEALKAVMPDTSSQEPNTISERDINTNKISVFPNPTSSSIQISGLSNSVYTVTWVALNGARLRERVHFTEGVHLSVPQTSGIYFLEIISDNAEIFRTKVIVK